MTLLRPTPHDVNTPTTAATTKADTTRPHRRTAPLLAISAAALAVPVYLALHVPHDAFGLADLLWTAGLLLIVGVAGQVALRRAAIAWPLAVLLIGVMLFAITPRAASQRNGDPALLRYIDMFSGYRDVSTAVIDPDDPQPVRFANTGSTPTTRFEIGSVTKALTGMVMADAADRGELVPGEPVSSYLTQLRGTPVGDVAVQDLTSHRSGLAEFGAASIRHAYWAVPLGRNFLTTDQAGLLREAEEDPLRTRGDYAYSTLGAALAGQATVAATGLSYPDLLRTRLFGPLAMSDSAVQATPLVPGGRAVMGRPIQPWAMTGYAPGGAVVSTSQDLARLALAILRGTAPGLAALTPTEPTGAPGTRIGMFWMTSRWTDGRTVTWHNGGTGGYTSWIGIDREHHRAAVVLSDDAKTVDDLGAMLLTADPS